MHILRKRVQSLILFLLRNPVIQQHLISVLDPIALAIDSTARISQLQIILKWILRWMMITSREQMNLKK
jgi:hypothetical protein